jgi:hypothetical protein
MEDCTLLELLPLMAFISTATAYQVTTYLLVYTHHVYYYR